MLRSAEERSKRIEATTLIHGDCREELPKLPAASVDVVITDPIYPEIDREYGRISEPEWHDLMHVVVRECRRILKPHGSAVFILQPNYEHVGQMRLWLWEFLVWAAREWNLVQDVYSWTTDALPLAGTSRTQGLMRQSVKMCVWLGPKDCYRNQDNVLRTPSEKTSNRSCSDNALRVGRNDWNYRVGTMASAAAERGGTTPFNLLPISNSGARGDHPATTPYRLAAWWCRYLLARGRRAARPVRRRGNDLGGRAGLRSFQGAGHRAGGEVCGDGLGADSEGEGISERHSIKIAIATLIRHGVSGLCPSVFPDFRVLGKRGNLESWKAGSPFVPESRQDAFTGNGTVFARWNGGSKASGTGGGKGGDGLSGFGSGEGPSGQATPAAGSQRIKTAFATLIGHGVFWRIIARVSRLSSSWKSGNLETWKPVPTVRRRRTARSLSKATAKISAAGVGTRRRGDGSRVRWERHSPELEVASGFPRSPSGSEHHGAPTSPSQDHPPTTHRLNPALNPPAIASGPINGG